MARCPHGFNRSLVPCESCGDRNPTYSRKPTKPRPRLAVHPGFKDLTGQSFCGAIVVARANNTIAGSACWMIRLPCGHERTAVPQQLRAPRARWNCHVCSKLK